MHYGHWMFLVLTDVYEHCVVIYLNLVCFPLLISHVRYFKFNLSCEEIWIITKLCFCFTQVGTMKRLLLCRQLIRYSFKYNQKDAALYNIFIIVNALHVSGGFSAHHQELKKSTRSICYMPSLLAATARVGEFQITHACVSSKLGLHQMLCIQFLSSWWWAEKPPETCRALTVIKNVV